MRLKPLALLLFVLAVPDAQAATVETFVTPDSGFEALRDFISSAGHSLIIATYTFSSPEIMDLVLERAAASVEVEVMVEKSPAGGMPEAQLAVLCRLAEGNVSVMLYDGQLRYMHAKYMITGDSVLVTSENLGTTGFSPEGDYGNRGWGAVVHDQEVSRQLMSIYELDRAASVPFECSQHNLTLSRWDPAGAYVPVQDLGRQAFHGQHVEVLASPDSLAGLLGMIDSANSSIDVQQFYVYPHWGSVKYDTTESAPSPMLEALIEKARAGVRVRLLLDSTYYNMDEETGVNRQTIEYLNSLAGEEGIPIHARAIDLDGHGLAKVHNKGMVIDGRVALVSSINWNENSVLRNREVGIVITGEAAEHYSQAFALDWGDGQEDYGLGFVPAMASLAALIIAVVYLGRRG